MRMGVMEPRRWLALLWFSLLLLGGCARYVAHRIVTPEHHDDAALAEVLTQLGVQRVGVPGATAQISNAMAYWLASPRRYDAHWQSRLQQQGGQLSIDFTLRVDGEKPYPPLPARGSVLLLHPWGGDGALEAPWIIELAQAGYVVLAVDLPGHGGSRRLPVGYGPAEAEALAGLVQTLRERGQLPGPLVLMGASYGGAVALFTAPRIPAVQAVVALVPYANAAQVIRRAPSSGLFAPRWVGRLLGRRGVEHGIARASRQLGVELTAVDSRQALTGYTGCTLLLGAQYDPLVWPGELREIAAGHPRVQYLQMEGQSHLSLPLDLGELAVPIEQWLVAVADAAEGVCPRFVPAASTLAQQRFSAAQGTRPDGSPR